jgi:hypothetical protein
MLSVNALQREVQLSGQHTRSVGCAWSSHIMRGLGALGYLLPHPNLPEGQVTQVICTSCAISPQDVHTYHTI